MKSTKLILCLAAVAAAALATSCRTKTGDDVQLKSYILMSNVDNDYKRSLTEDYYNLIAQDKVKKVVLSSDKVTLIDGTDTRECNPWLEYCREFFAEDKLGFVWRGGWNLDRDKTEQEIRSLWQKECVERWKVEDINALQNRIKESEDRRARYAAHFNDRKVDEMNQEINRGTLSLFALEHYSDMEATGLLIANAYVEYIYKTAKNRVKVYDCEYSEYYSTKSVDSYYIIYTIDDDYYVLVRYSKVKKSTRFEIETLSRRKELIEIERDFKKYL